MNIRGTSFPYLVVTRVFTSFRPLKAELFRTEKEAMKSAKFEVQQSNRESVEIWLVTNNPNYFNYTLLWQSTSPKRSMVRPKDWNGER